MPYKDKEKQKEAQHRSYLKHKELVRDRNRERRKEYKEWFAEIRSKLKCQECGENHIAVLDFHHTDDNKEGGVGRLVRSLYPKEKILKEIAKCIVLCSNCHRKLHFWEY